VARKIISRVEKPVLLIQQSPGGNGAPPGIRKILVTLDGSETAARILPYVEMIAGAFGSEVLLLTVPEVPEAERYGPMADLVLEMRQQAEITARDYLERVAEKLQTEEREVRVLVTGSNPARTIYAISEEEGVDLIMMATHGRGGLDRLFMGSVAERVVQHTERPVFLLPVQEQEIPIPELSPA
jgi:nucleotide-binding universal stress UspA family protein